MDNTKLMSPEEQKDAIFQILLYLDKICRDNDICYSLTGGTLLGAVRHKGFIPWDDDIDVFLIRPEYDKLSRILSEQKEYRWIAPELGNYHAGCGRLIDPRTVIIDEELGEQDIGLFVDICVVDGLPNNRIIRSLFIAYQRALYRLRRSTCEQKKISIPRNPVKRTVKRIVRKWTVSRGPYYWAEIINRTRRKYPVEKSVHVANLQSQYGAKKEILHKSGFDRYQEMLFEGHSFLVFSGWKEYLTNIYGDYMRLPPEEDRHGHHYERVYRKGQENE